MKRNAALVFAAFFLLISTGAYVCAFSCGSAFVIDLFKTASSQPKQENNHHSKACKGDQDCPCCKKHGNYNVKENLRPSVDVQFPEILLTLVSIVHSDFQRGYNYVFETTTWAKNHAPPTGSSMPIFIKIHSLLI